MSNLARHHSVEGELIPLTCPRCETQVLIADPLDGGPIDFSTSNCCVCGTCLFPEVGDER